MKRLCFDTESNYFKSDLSVGSIQYHRECMENWLARGNRIRFDCAVIYDEQTERHYEFRGNQADDLVEMLAGADELISHSGQRHDLVILEHVSGTDRIAPLWRITHHDLFDIFNWSSLDDLANKLISEHRLRDFKAARDRHVEKAGERFPEERRNFRPPDYFVECRLAKARFDVDRTYAVFRAYLETQK